MKAAASFHPNFIFADDESGETVILHGDNLASQTNYGEEVDPTLVESVFRPENETAQRRFVQLFSHTPDDVLALARVVRDWTEKEQGIRLSQSTLIALCEELDRVLQGLPPQHTSFPDGLELLYPQESAAAHWALKQVSLQMGQIFEEQTARSITWTMVGEQLELVHNQPKLRAITTLLGEMVHLIEETLQRTLVPTAPDTRRFLLHLRFLARRVLNDNPNLHEVDPKWYESFSQKYPEAHRCALRVADFVEAQYHHQMGIDEQMYLLIHLAQMLRAESKLQT